MQSNLFKLSIYITLLIFVGNYSAAHIGEHEYIELLTNQIQKDPDNPELYFKRGEQHRLAGHFEQALSDFIMVESIDGDYYLVDLGRGQLFMDFGWYITAEFYLNRFLSNTPDNVVALTYLARSLSAQYKGVEASDVYTKILSLVSKPSPDFFMEMANAYLLSNNHTEALRCLDEGIEILGHITSLEKYAIEIELAYNNYSNALKRLESLISYSPQKERWMLEKGLLLESLGNYKQAAQTYEGALNHLKTRPVNRRKIQAISALEKEIKKALDRVSQKL